MIPQVELPAAELAALRQAYSAANVILEFGAGASTILAARLGKRVFTVENDKSWIEKTQKLASAAVFHYVDTGPVGAFGWPKNKNSRHGLDYALSIWCQPNFLPPDVVFIDGRFRVACFLAVLLYARQETTVLFDDYSYRPVYHCVERFATIKQRVGRLGIFDVRPDSANDSALTAFTTAAQIPA